MTQFTWSNMRRMLMAFAPALALTLPAALPAQEATEQAEEKKDSPAAALETKTSDTPATSTAEKTATETTASEEAKTSESKSAESQPGSATGAATKSQNQAGSRQRQQQSATDRARSAEETASDAAERVTDQADSARTNAQRQSENAPREGRDQARNAQQEARGQADRARDNADQARRRASQQADRQADPQDRDLSERDTSDQPDRARRDRNEADDRDQSDDRRDRVDGRRDNRELDRDDRRDDRADRRYSQDRQSTSISRDVTRFGLSFGTQSNRLVVNDIQRASVFGRFGIRRGDVIVSVGGRPVRTQADFNRYVFVEDVDRVPVIVLRDGVEETIYITTDEIYSEEPGYDVSVERSTQQSGSAYLGVSLDERYQGGALVRTVQPGSPAEEAGLDRGDIITAVNGRDVNNSSELLAAVRRMQPGDELDIEFSRRVNDTTLVVLGAQRGQTTQTTRVYEESDQPELRYSEERVDTYRSGGVRVNSEFNDVDVNRYEGGDAQFRAGGTIQRDTNDRSAPGGVRGILRGRRN